MERGLDALALPRAILQRQQRVLAIGRGEGSGPQDEAPILERDPHLSLDPAASGKRLQGGRGQRPAWGPGLVVAQQAACLPIGVHEPALVVDHEERSR